MGAPLFKDTTAEATAAAATNPAGLPIVNPNAPLAGEASAATPAPTAGDTTSKLLENLTKMSEGFVSSDTSAQDTFFKDITKRAEAAAESGKKGIEASYELAKIEAEKAGEQKLTSELESRRGFATNSAVIRQIEEDTAKTLKDLDLRKQVALTSGDIELADKLGQLQLKAYEMNMDTKRNAFTNMLNLGQFALSVQSKEDASNQIHSTVTVGDKVKILYKDGHSEILGDAATGKTTAEQLRQIEYKASQDFLSNPKNQGLTRQQKEQYLRGHTSLDNTEISSLLDTEKIIDEEYLKSLFSGATIEEQLATLGKDRGDYSEYLLMAGDEEKNITKDYDAFIKSTMKSIDAYRQFGYTDKEILKMLQ